MSDSPKLSTKNTIFYSSANADYALYAAVSLLTVRDYLPEAKLHILSSGLSDHTRKILDKNDISYHELDLSDKFTKTWEYPIDCYYLFAGPELFRNQGYDYSVYVDGDVLCASNPLDGLPSIRSVAGVESASVNGSYTSIFGHDWEGIKKIWGLTESKGSQKRIHSGMVYFNNEKMSEMRLLDKAEMMFKKCLDNNIPRKGDDSLFSLLQYVYMSEEDIEFLPSRFNFVLQFNEWRYPVEGLVFFHFSVDKPWKKHPYRHDEEALAVFNPYVRLWRAKFRRVSPSAWLESLLVVGRILRAATFRATNLKRLLVDQILWIRGLKKSYFTRRSNASKAPLKLFWWQETQNNIINFGDEITREIIQKTIGYQSLLTPVDQCEVIGAGSLLEIVAHRNPVNTISVWGSGYIGARGDSDDKQSGLLFYAVRGEKTRERIGGDSSVALGDPGLLANIVYPKAAYVTNKIGIVVHYADRDLPIADKIRQDPRFIIISPLKSAEEVAKLITSCKFVFSSSLHGLIFADSYGVPNVHAKLSDRLTGGTYKFEDYYSATHREYKAADINKLFDDGYVQQLIVDYRPIQGLRALQRGLIRAFPRLR